MGERRLYWNFCPTAVLTGVVKNISNVGMKHYKEQYAILEETGRKSYYYVSRECCDQDSRHWAMLWNCIIVVENTVLYMAVTFHRTILQNVYKSNNLKN